MTPERWRQIAEIIHAALERDEETREAFLVEACQGDSTLRAEVDALLATHGGALPDSGPATTLTYAFPETEPAEPAGVRRVEELLEAAGESGHFKIVGQVGQGGSGVVYRAIDTRLNRAVAIKAIHGTRLMDARVTARLRTEALAAASLDHPYICRIYELVESGDHKLIIMEFVEGETLSSVLARGIPSLAQTLQFAIEVGEGLANAHERGLVHRDLKPSNVMVTPHGHIKLLDFGLALADAESTPTDATRMARKATDAYAGTPQYMAPEQAAGRAVTARSDVFSFGVVLFRCVTGALPFKGGSPYDYAGHLLSDAPIPVHRLAPEIPADLARLIDRCLEKNPASRPESAGAVVQALRRLAEELGSSSGAFRSIRADRAQTRWRLVATAGVLAAAAILVWIWYPRPGSADTIWRSRPFVTAASEESGSRISPDGQWLAYMSGEAAETSLMVQRIGGGAAQRVVLPAGRPMGHFWSPRGDQLAYVVRQGEHVLLQVVPAFFGGIPVRNIAIVPAPNEVRLLRWIDETIYLEGQNIRGAFLLRVDLARGTSESVGGAWTAVGRLMGLDVDLHGTQVAFTVSAEGQEDLWVAGLDGSGARRLTNDRFFERLPLWSRTGATVIFQSNRGGQIDLWEVALDSDRFRQLTSSRSEEQPESASPDGSIVSFRQVSEESHLWMWNVAGGEGSQLTDDGLGDLWPTTSGSGSEVVFQRSHASALAGQPVVDASLLFGTVERGKFPSDPKSLADGFAARISPDGTRLAYLQRGANPTRGTLVVRNLQTSDTVTVTSTFPLPAYVRFPIELVEQNLAWAASSGDLYFVDRPDRAAIRRYRVGAAQAEPVIVSANPGQSIHDLHLSSDGRTLAYLVSTSKTSALHLLDIATGVGRVVAPFETRVSARGWLAGDEGVVIVRSSSAGEDATTTIDLVVVSAAGRIRPAGRIDRAFAATTRLDRTRSMLYVTRSEAGVHNLYALSLAARLLRRVTGNTLPGVTFSGFEPLDGGAILGVRHERKSDIWLMEAASPEAGTPAPQSR